MNLIIDVGNTRIKIAIFNNGKSIHNESITNENFEIRTLELVNFFKCDNAIISSVGSLKKTHTNELSSEINLIELGFKTKLPFKNNYSTPKTLGVDRIALVAAAISKFPNQNILIVDAGTCITYDFVNSEGVYCGGAISPGINMRYKSLQTFTNNLPLLEPEYLSCLVGNSSESSIHVGVVKGTIGEIDSFINQYREKNKDLTVVLTGGDTNFLSNKLKNVIFANPFFLMEGLNTILKYNL